MGRNSGGGGRGGGGRGGGDGGGARGPGLSSLTPTARAQARADFAALQKYNSDLNTPRGTTAKQDRDIRKVVERLFQLPVGARLDLSGGK